LTCFVIGRMIWMMISSWNYNKTVCLKTSPIEIKPEKISAQISP